MTEKWGGDEGWGWDNQGEDRELKGRCKKFLKLKWGGRGRKGRKMITAQLFRKYPILKNLMVQDHIHKSLQMYSSSWHPVIATPPQNQNAESQCL